MKEVENTTPVVPVSDLQRSIVFYTGVLGFTLDWGGADGDTICSVSRDGHGFMLTLQAEIRPPACVWIGLETPRLFEEYRDKGVTILQEPENHPWAYDMKIQDPDGNILWLGTAPKQ
jgi:catechol 2,3-dioxygenase-like lactoylglutathione lyase family enzyme